MGVHTIPDAARVEEGTIVKNGNSRYVKIPPTWPDGRITIILHHS